jgi:hypothetical protein
MRIFRKFTPLKTALIAAFLSISLTAVAHAERRHVTPYGDYCKEYSVYGICRDALPPDEALLALAKYYRAKGCRVLIVQHQGRFIVADVYRKQQQVDKIVFDRKTGRLRSIY